MAIRILSNQTIDSTLSTAGAITSGGNLRANSGNLFVGNGSNTTARIYGFADYEMITGVSGATYLRVSGSNTLAGTLQAGQYILATGLAYGAVNSYTQIIDGSTGAITGTTANFTGSVNITGGTTNGLNITTSGTQDTIKIDRAATNDNAITKYQTASADKWIVGLRNTGDDNFRFYSYGTSTDVLTINQADGNATFTGKIIAEKGVQITGGTIAEATAVLHTNNILYFRGGPSGFYLQNGDGSDGYYISPTFHKWEVNGSESMRLTSTGLGIGVTSPNAILDISAGTNLNTSFRQLTLDNYSNEGIGITFTRTTSDSDLMAIGVVDTDSLGLFSRDGIVFATGGTSSYTQTEERMRITSAGNVGIGTTSPTRQLHILNSSGDNRGIMVENTVATSYAEVQIKAAREFRIGTGGSSSDSNASDRFYIFDATASAHRFTIGSTGNVGIGTTSPGAQLHNYSTAATNVFITGHGTAAQNDWGAQNCMFVKTDNGLLISKANAANNTNRIFNFYNDNNGYAQLYMHAGATAFVKIQASGDSYFNGGNVGIGSTNPTSISANTNSLTVGSSRNDLSGAIVYQANGTIKSQMYWDSAGLQTVVNSGDARWYTGGVNDRLRITSGGNVGIGTGTPATKLNVANAGEVIVRSSMTAADGFRGGFEADNQHTGGTIWSMFSTNNSDGYFGGGKYVIANESMGGVDANTTAKFVIDGSGNVGIGETQPNYNLEIGGTANPVVAIVSNINSATSSLYFGDSDAKDRGQIKYTHFGDFMEIKTGGGLRLYLESGINTAYTSDGLFNANATPSYWNHGQAQFKLGYMDNGSGLYSGAYCFNVKSTDGIPVTGREIGAIYVRDTSNNRMPLIISNQGRINLNQTNTSTGYGSSTGWISVQNGTGAYNIFNYYTGTDGNSGCARYRVDNTSPSFFDFYYSTTQVGYITTNGTDIFYANTSDYRLKEDLKSFDGMSLLEQIQVYDFKWKESDNRMYGVVAHELQEVIPQAVVGEKDKEKLQAVDYSKLVPVLIKSIQELEARVKQLENN